MKKFIWITYGYNGVRGTVVVSDKLSSEEIKKVCMLDYIDKTKLINSDKIYFFGKSKFKYENL